MKKYTICYFCADQIDVITHFAVKTNVVIKRVHCMTVFVLNLGEKYRWGLNSLGQYILHGLVIK